MYCTTQLLQLSKRAFVVVVVVFETQGGGVRYPDWQTVLDFFLCLFFAFSCLIIARVKLNPRCRRGKLVGLLP